MLATFLHFKCLQAQGSFGPLPLNLSFDVLRESQVGAVDEHETLTSLGYHLALLPVDVHVGKVSPANLVSLSVFKSLHPAILDCSGYLRQDMLQMILYGAIFGCLSPIVTVAACLSHKTPFVIPHDEVQLTSAGLMEFHRCDVPCVTNLDVIHVFQREAAARKIQTLLTEAGQDISKQDARKLHQSDHLAMVAAYNHWVKLRQVWMQFLEIQNNEEICSLLL